MNEELKQLIGAEAFTAIAEDLGWGEYDDVEFAETFETLEDFDASRNNNWADAGRREGLTYAGLEARYFSDFRVAKGQQRRTMVVLDLGGKRVCLH